MMCDRARSVELVVVTVIGIMVALPAMVLDAGVIPLAWAQSTPSPVTTVSDVLQDADHHQVVVDSGGNAVFAWREVPRLIGGDPAPGERYNQRVRTRARDINGALSPMLPIAWDNPSAFPQLSVDATGHVVYTWVMTRNPSAFYRHLQTVNGRLSLEDWDDYGFLADGGPYAMRTFSPAVAVGPDRSAVFAWKQCRDTYWRCVPTDVWVRTLVHSSPSSVPILGEKQRLPNTGVDLLEVADPRVAMDPSGQAIVVWSYGTTINFATRAPDGELSPTEALGSGTNPTLAVHPDGTVVFLWISANEREILHRVRGADGTLGDAETLATSSGSLQHAGLGVDASGITIFVWTDTLASSRPRYRIRTPDGALGPIRALAETGTEASVAVSASGRAVFVWEGSDGTNQRIQTRAHDADGTLRAIESVSPPGTDAYAPRVAVDPVGHAMFIWRRYDGGHWLIETRGDWCPTPAVSDDVAFGPVPVAGSADRSFTVSNPGDDRVMGRASTSGAFSIVSGGSWSLEAGESRTVMVRFAPTLATTFTGDVTFSGCEKLSRAVSGIGTGADLRVAALSDPPATALSGAWFAVSDTVQNFGAASGPSRVRYYLSSDTTKDTADVRLARGKRDVPELATEAQSSATTVVAIPMLIVPGRYALIACADDKRAVAETDERNNCRASTTMVEVAAAPDLRVMSVSDPPATARVGDTFAVSDTTRNQGALGSGASRTRHYLTKERYRRPSGDHLLAPARDVEALAPGAESTGTGGVSIPATVVAGEYYLTACADDQGIEEEGREDNNCRASATTVSVRPDLRVTTMTNPPASAPRGVAFAMTATVKNIGSVGAGTSMTRYYLSADTVKDAGDRRLAGGRGVTALAAGAESTGTATVTIVSTVPLGTYWLLACADGDGTLIESNETNNCRASTTTITVTPGP